MGEFKDFGVGLLLPSHRCCVPWRLGNGNGRSDLHDFTRARKSLTAFENNYVAFWWLGGCSVGGGVSSSSYNHNTTSNSHQESRSTDSLP